MAAFRWINIMNVLHFDTNNQVCPVCTGRAGRRTLLC
jgi:hypothetical protein